MVRTNDARLESITRPLKDSNYITAIPAADAPEALEGLAHDFVMMGAGGMVWFTSL